MGLCQVLLRCFLRSSVAGRSCHRMPVSLLRENVGKVTMSLHAGSIILATHRESTVSPADAQNIGGVRRDLFNALL